LELFLVEVPEEHLVAQVSADGPAFAHHQRDDDHEEAEHEDEPEREQKKERLAIHGRDIVPDGVEGDPEQISEEWPKRAPPALAGLPGEAEADSRHRGVKRMPPRGENAADEERGAERILNLTPRVVADVLDGGEP